MEIYVAVDDNPTGPYTVEEVRRLLATGQIRPENRAWREGMGEWEPLGAWFQPEPSEDGEVVLPPPPTAPTRTLQIGLYSLAAWVVLIVLAAMLGPSKPGEESGLLVVLGLLMFATFGTNLAGAVMGGLAVYRTGPQRAAVAGLALNLLQVLVILAMFAAAPAKH